MRKTKRRSEISVETDDLFFIKTMPASTQAWCPHCSRVVATVRAEAVAAWVKTDAVHVIKSVDGGLLICVDSLQGRFGGPKMQ